MFDHDQAQVVTDPQAEPNAEAAAKEEYHCPNCHKVCTSKPGLTLHLKKCKPTVAPMSTPVISVANVPQPFSISKTEVSPVSTAMSHPNKVTDIDPRHHSEEFDDQYQQPRYHQRQHQKPRQPQNDMGAFKIISHLTIMIDFNLAMCLADAILDNRTDNRALIAMAHQLKALDEADDGQ